MSKAQPPQHVDLRKHPSQKRSRATFEKIMASTAELLDEVGLDGFNTNLLAERTGIAVSAIYRYFPDKFSIVATFAQMVVEEWDSWFEDFAIALQQTDDFPLVWNRYVDQFVKSVKAQPGGLAVRRAMQSSPVLRSLDQDDNERLAARLATTLITHYPTIPKAQAQVSARLLIESVVTAVDLSLAAPPARAKQLIVEVKRMNAAYFTQLLESSQTTTPG
ncbi:MAG: TetR/AcrR family transcriptional regulator [Pseudomonadota bacterium]